MTGGAWAAGRLVVRPGGDAQLGAGTVLVPQHGLLPRGRRGDAMSRGKRLANTLEARSRQEDADFLTIDLVRPRPTTG